MTTRRGIFRSPSRLSPGRGWAALRALALGSGLYDMTLGNRTPSGLGTFPPECRPGDPAKASAILQGAFTLAGRKMPLGEKPWSQQLDAAAGRELHGFGWLRDLGALGSENAARRAQHLTDEWIAQHQRWDGLSWRADVIGDRLANWLVNFTFLDQAADTDFRHRLLHSMARQSRHLGRVAARETGGTPRLLAIKGLIACGIGLVPGDKLLAHGLKLLEREIATQILPDGGHYQRSPSGHLEALGHLVDMRAALVAAHEEVPLWLQSALDRMIPVLRCFRHGDGRLALFNGGHEGVQQEIDTVLAQAGARGRALQSAPHSGFNRLTGGRTMVIVDVGAPPPPGADAVAHAGALSFEMSLGKERLVVNCGAQPPEDSDWFAALRATAAHSTLTVNDTNSAVIQPSGGLGRGPVGVTSTRREGEGAVWVDSLHDGYQKSLGLIHHRSLYLSADGTDFRGHDKLIGAGGQSFAVRFHLHPRVQTSTIQDGTAVLVRLPGGGGWRFMASGGRIDIEASVYAGLPDGHRRRCEQIVVSGKLNGKGAEIKWAFRREGGRGQAKS